MPVLSAPAAPTHALDGARFTALATPTRGSTDTSVWIVEIDPGAPAHPHELTRQEVFVVLSGRAALAVEGGATLELGPGSVVRLPEGASTVWTVTETLRKIYVTPRA